MLTAQAPAQTQVQDSPAARPGGADGRTVRLSPLVPVPAGAVVDAASMLVALHARVERQFVLYEQAEGSHPKQRRAVRAISSALATHDALEDELLYPALRAQTARHNGEIQRQLEQDHLLEAILVELGGMIPADQRFDAKVGVLMQVFRQHARDSEALMVPELRRRLAPAEDERLARRLLERIGQLESRPRPGW